MARMSYNQIRKIAGIVEHFDLGAGTIDNIETFGDGRINKTYKITMKQGNERMFYLLQNVNHFVFPDTKRMMENLTSVTDFIRKEGKIGLEYIRCKNAADNNGPYIYVDNSEEHCHWRMYYYIDAEVYPCIIHPYQAYMLGEAIADFTRSLDGYDAKHLFETIPDFHNTPKRFVAFLLSLSLDSVHHKERIKGCEEVVKFVLDRKDKLGILVEALEEGKIPCRVVHNDPKLNNVLFDKVTNKPICMIDLDTIMPGTGLYDVGDALRSIANTASEDDKTTENVSFSIEIYEEFVKGYIKGMGETLVEAEKQLIPMSAWTISMELGMRFLKDHIDGNIYFKTEYDGQNLERAQVQLALAEDIEKKMEAGLLNKVLQ